MGIATVRSTLDLKGRVRFATFGEDGEMHDERVNDNLLVTVGLNILATGLNWAIIQNQNASFGSPYSLVNLGNAYGAVGTSNTAPAAGQTALSAEVGRAICSNGAVSLNVLTYDFFFGLTQGNGSIAEAGMFLQAGLVTGGLTVALANGSNYTSLSVTATTGDIPASSTIIIGYGTGQTQTITTTAVDTPPGSTTINVVSFNANANYAGGSVVAYLPGTMMDRSIFATPIVKTNIETGLLEVTLTLVSG
jgi:hypothetical protein